MKHTLSWFLPVAKFLFEQLSKNLAWQPEHHRFEHRTQDSEQDAHILRTDFRCLSLCRKSHFLRDNDRSKRTKSTVTVLFSGASGCDGEHEGVKLGGVGFEVPCGRGRARVPYDPLGSDQVVVRGLVDPADKGLP